MENTMPDDFAGTSVDRLARQLMVCAKKDPALIRRPGFMPFDGLSTRRTELPVLLRARADGLRDT